MADATSERDIVRAVADERASVCSCTCYGRSTARSRAGDDERNGSGGETKHSVLAQRSLANFQHLEKLFSKYLFTSFRIGCRLTGVPNK